MLKFLPQQEWTNLVSKTRTLYFNEQPEVVQAITDSFKVVPVYAVFLKKEKPVITLIAYTHKNKIVIPIHFFYAAFWIENELSDTAYCNYLGSFLAALKEKYRKINLRLPVEITDIRPFLWTGFRVKNRYTYIKSLDSLSYSQDVEKNLKDENLKQYTFRSEKLDKDSLEINLQIFKMLKTYPQSKIMKIDHLLANLANTSYLNCFNVYQNHQLLASHILFADHQQKTAYTVLKNKAEIDSSKSIHTILYHQLFNALKNEGYELVDLLGADIEPIAAFKSRFNAKLFPYYMVSYSKTQAFIDQKMMNLRENVKKILSKF